MLFHKSDFPVLVSCHFELAIRGDLAPETKCIYQIQFAFLVLFVFIQLFFFSFLFSPFSFLVSFLFCFVSVVFPRRCQEIDRAVLPNRPTNRYGSINRETTHKPDHQSGGVTLYFISQHRQYTEFESDSRSASSFFLSLPLSVRCFHQSQLSRCLSPFIVSP